ncbi:probable fatty acyl-CoA reductase 4 [Mangifera indica]|uniref:probable fatty acyl-CoA reductase 4 n=1 Tax=Mangifera indica TaxID=29780 RepID=UPI001CFAD444|nr:probable fatty acyl-CoA reductase 4 [Mangifera indica]
MESVGALRILKDKTILVTGATGFLAKIFVEKILRIQPNVKKLYLLVRAEDTQSAMKRVQNEIVEKDLFRVVRETCGANLEPFISEKVASVAGDVSLLNLGIKDSEVMEKMLTEIDLVINFAATTNFDERYDVALNTNTMGALHVLNFAKKCVNITMLLHVSTAYVCGERSGIIPENPFYSGETLRRTCELVINAEKKLIEKQLNQLRAENATEKEAISTMQDLGIRRARLYGWPNTYAFTKAMGEMLLGNFRDDLPLVITRPTMVTSTYSEPFPGWIEGVRTIDGPILCYVKGKLKFFYGNPDTILDLVS